MRLAPKSDVPQVAIVESSAGRRRDIVEMLRPYYRISEYDDGDRSFEALVRNPPAVALIAERVMPLGGYELVKRLRQVPELVDLPVILIVSRAGKVAQDGLAWCGANQLLTWPFRHAAALRVISSYCNMNVEKRWDYLPPLPRSALKGTMQLFNGISDSIGKGEALNLGTLNEACGNLVEAVNHNQFKTILDAVREHDDYTYVHCIRVAIFLSLFGYITGLSKQDQVLLASGGLLHDVGKVNVAYEVLNKPARLNPSEFELVKSHVESSIQLLETVSDIPRPIVTIAAQHHEKLDGSGYPYGLAAGQLNELARMAAIVDVFGALTDRRTYKPAIDAEIALMTMVEDMSDQLDKRLMSIFRQVLLDAAIYGEEET